MVAIVAYKVADTEVSAIAAHKVAETAAAIALRMAADTVVAADTAVAVEIVVVVLAYKDFAY